MLYTSTRQTVTEELIFSSSAAWFILLLTTKESNFAQGLMVKDSWFLPFDKGYNDGREPPNPNGLKTGLSMENNF